jgi:hypothetical protein
MWNRVCIAANRPLSTNRMKHSPISETDSQWTGQEICHFLYNPKCHVFPADKDAPEGSVLI